MNKIRKSENLKCLKNNAVLCLKTIITFFSIFYLRQFWIITLFAIQYFLRMNSMYLQSCGSFKAANHQKRSANCSSAKLNICRRATNSNLLMLGSYQSNILSKKGLTGSQEKGERETSARNYRPSFHENKPKTLVLYDWKRAFWACFHENWVYKFGHRTITELEKWLCL
jgi:hypothetical protein